MPRRRAVSAARPFMIDRPRLGRNVVKSAERVVHILEFFDDLKSSATVADIAGILDMPQSSTSALLRSLTELGYLDYDGVRRLYSPTIRVSLLGNWINSEVMTEGPVIKCVRDISERSGLNAFLTMRNKLHVQFINFQYCPDPAIYYGTGSCRFLVAMATGHALMSGLPDTDIARIVVATNAALNGERPPFSIRDLLDKVAKVRRDGYAVGEAVRSPHCTTIALPLQHVVNGRLAIGTSIDTRHDRRKPGELAALMSEAVEHWLPHRPTNSVGRAFS